MCISQTNVFDEFVDHTVPGAIRLQGSESVIQRGEYLKVETHRGVDVVDQVDTVT